MGERLPVEQQQAMHTLRHVPARERCTRDIADVGIDPHRIAGFLARELRAPCRKPDRIAVRFAVSEHLERPHGSVGIECNPVRDQLDLADHFVDDKPAQRALARAHSPHARLDLEAPGFLGDRRLDIGGDQHRLEGRRIGKRRALRRLDRQIVDRVGELRYRRDECRGRGNQPRVTHDQWWTASKPE